MYVPVYAFRSSPSMELFFVLSLSTKIVCVVTYMIGILVSLFTSAQFHALIQYPDSMIATNAKAVSSVCVARDIKYTTVCLHVHRVIYVQVTLKISSE